MKLRRNKLFWEHQLVLLAQSGLSLAAFAKREGLSSKSLYNFRHKLKFSSTAKPTRAPAPASFVPVRFSAPVGLDSSPRCVLVLPSGHRLELSSLPPAQWLQSLSLSAVTPLGSR
jgi:transposase